jgi:subtilisin family serine protease
VIFAVAAGNESDDARFHQPSRFRNVITVGSSDSSDTKSSFSNFNAIDFLAPGGDSGGTYAPANILSLRASGTDMYGDGSHTIGGSYMRASGTSMATPFVTGAIGLLLSNNNALGREEVRSILRLSAYKPGGKNYSSDSGYGRIDLPSAFNLGNKYNVARIILPTSIFINNGSPPIQFSFYAYGQTFSRWIF